MGQQKSRHRTNATRLTRASWAALGLAAGFALVAAPTPARAGDGDSFYKATFGRVLTSLGLKSGDDEQINYRERAPLVLPPSSTLPPPEKADTTVNPAWPKDPDVAHRKLLEKQEKARPDRETERRESEDPKLMTPDKLAPGPRPRGVKNPDTEGPSALGKLLSPSELGYKGGLFGTMFHGKDSDVARFTGEPPRTDLTEPPPGYQTPSPEQPYGVGQAKPTEAENDYLHRGELKR
jgi:hypothetical protein